MPTETARTSTSRLVTALMLSGVFTLVAAVALGLLVEPALFALALVAVVDFAVAGAFARGRIGPLAALRQAEGEGDAAAIAEADPGYNPYARED